MKFIPVKTRKFLPPRDDIYDLLETSLPKVREGDVLFVTSKIAAIHQGRCVKIQPGVDKDKLIIREAEKYISHARVPKGYAVLTLKGHTLIPSAGIDESNSNGYYILWPKNPNKAAKEICQFLKRKYKIKKLAVVITDSRTIPLRYGVIGVSIGFFGLAPVLDLRGRPDIFGRKLKITRVNVVDALAAIAVFLMGEAAQQTPLLIIRDARFVKFTTRDTYKKLIIPAKTDLYYPLLQVFKKK